MVTFAQQVHPAHASAQRNYSLLTLLIFLLIATGAIFYVKPTWDDLTSLRLGRDEKQTQKDNLSRQLQELQTLQQSLNQSTEVNQQTTLYAIPEHFEQDNLIMDLTDIAQQNDIILNGVNFGVATNSTDKIKKATVNANLTGDMGGLLSFLKEIEANERKLLVKSVTVQSGQTESGVARVNFNVTMETYYQESI